MGKQAAIESQLCEIASQVLFKDESEIDISKTLLDQGGDTLSSVFFAGQCRDVGLLVEVDHVSTCSSLRELASQLIQTSGDFEFGDDAEANASSASFTELQDLYSSAGLCQAWLCDIKTPLSHGNALQMLKWLAERHPILTALSEAATPPSVDLFPYESDEQSAAQVRQFQQEVSRLASKELAFNALLFGEWSEIKQIGLIAPASALDARSWETLLQDIQLYLPGAQPAAEQAHVFFNWAEERVHAKGREAQANGTEKDVAADPDPLRQHLSLLSHEFALSSELTESLYSDECQSTLRTEPADLVFGSLAAAFQDQLPQPTSYLEIRDGRPLADDYSWHSVVGCFDELVEIPYSYVGDACLNVSRSAKDARRRSASSRLPKMLSGGNLILDSTELRRRDLESDSSRSMDEVPRRDVGQLVLQKLGGIYVLPYFASKKLSFLVMEDIEVGGQATIKTRSKAFLQHLQDTIIRLADSHPLPTLAEFPHICLDYPCLDRLFYQKLRHIVQKPLDEIENIYPCSPMQESILIANKIDKGSYICVFTVKVSTSGMFASCDAKRWTDAWAKVVDKHSSLRTVFIESEGRQGHFDQVVLKKVVPRVNVVQGVGAHADIQFQSFEVPHHLTVGRGGHGQFTLVLTISHAITDGHSAEVILSDMCGYIAGAGGNGEKALSYTDYVLNQHPPLGTTVSDYWPKYLQKTQDTQLPVNREKADLADFQTIKSVMPINVTSIDRLCQRHNINLATVCEFAWGVVLKSHLGVDDVSFSYISSVRHVPLKGIMKAVGPLITTLLCSMKINGDTNVLDAVKAAKEDYQEGLAHEAELSDAVSARRWSNTVMSFRRRLVQDDQSLPGLNCKLVGGASPTNYDVSLIVSAGQSGVEVNLDYWGSRMDREYAQRLLQNFQTALQSIIQNIGAKVSELELVSSGQEQQILERNLNVPNSVGRCVHHMVGDLIQAQPDATAVAAWDGTMTYRELDQKASRLAQRLVNIGAGPEVPIGLCLNKSKVVPVAMLAILRAGSAVVPIGIAEPLPRVKAILADSSPVAILGDERQIERLSEVHTKLLNVQDLIVDESSATPVDLVIEEGPAEPGNMAWIFYTSGSTGTPKGVILEHDSLATGMHAHGTALGVSPETRVLQFSAHTFDVSLQDLLTTLIYGGCICIPNEQDRLNDLAGVIRRLQVNTLAVTPSIASTVAPSDVPLVQKLIVFGEPVRPVVVESWLGKAVIFNAYGPTESSIFASVSKPFRQVEDVSNIGFPMNGNFWVTDPERPGRLVPPGAPGELLLEGPLLARGYLNDEAKTAAAFIQDPEFVTRLGLDCGRRFYRTGDIVRQNSDFSLAYIGRRDTQIKVRGQRLDVAEVEHWIVKSLDSALRAVVGLIPSPEATASPSEKGGVLFAAIEVSEDAGLVLPGSEDILPASDKLRDTLRKLRITLHGRLPSYMIPTFYIPLRKVPLTASSKTDRNRVRQLVVDMSATELQSYVADESEMTTDDEVLSETAQTLRELWAIVLPGTNSSSIRAGDHFLYRGGDSISAIELVEVARTKRIQMTVSDVLSFPRLEDLAQVIDERAGVNNGKPAKGEESLDPRPFSLWHPASRDRDSELADIASQCGLTMEDVEDVYPCTSLQQGMLAATQQRPEAYLVQRVYALSESIDIKRFHKAWQAMIERSPSMRTRILLGQPSGSLQVLSKKAPAWQYHNDIDKYVSEDQAHVMVPGEPLMRFAIVEDPSKGGRFFVWTAHHSMYDGWSAQLIYRQLATLFLDEELPPAVPFTRFIEHLQNDSDLGTDKAASFWRLQLEGDPPPAFPTMPTYYQPKPLTTVHSEIDASAAFSNPGLSLANTLRAGWAMTLSQYLGARDVVFGATLSGRNAPVAGITELIAPTITTVPVRVRVDSDKAVSEYLDDIQSQAVRMIAFEHTGFDNIKRLLPDLQAAVDVKNLLVIEPSATELDEEALANLGMRLANTALDAFDTFALTIQCQLPSNSSSSIKVEARFDDKVLGEIEAGVLLRQFGLWVSQFLDQANQDKPLHKLEEVSMSDLAQIKETNARIPVREVACLHHLVWQWASKQPSAPAVCAWDGGFTFAELRAQARKLASHLRSLGVGPYVRVTLCMNKAKWTAVCMFAILEAGGTVVLLGSQDPVPRLRTLIQDCEAKVLLTNEGHTERLSDSGPTVVDINDNFMANLPAPQVEGPVCPELTPYHPAWIVYTSGSTGNPKGSLLIHGGLATSLPSHGRASNWNTKSRTLQFSAHTFDVTIQEIMTTLCMGGCVCIPSEEQRVNALARCITEFNVNQLVMTFTVASMLNTADVPSVKQIALVGETAKPSVVERWLAHCQVINMYGPSECSVYSSCSKPMRTVEDGGVVGYPLDECNFWITNTKDFNRLVPIGVPGELLVENAWEAQEYINNPVLTARSFVLEPGFIKQLGLGGKGRRFYRTGDLIRQNPEGTYTYCGRIDTQVKFRGHRVDTGEVERWMGQLLKGVRTTAVDVIDLHAGQQTNDLVAVMDFAEDCALFEGEQPETEEVDGVKILAPSTKIRKALYDLKDALGEKLPPYMVPTAYLPWQKVPLNPSGKTNRAAVRRFLMDLDPESNLLQRYLADGDKDIKEPPQTKMGKKVQRLWAEVLSLDVDSIGAQDHFTRIGGDSLVAMKLVAAGRQAGLKLTVSSIFSYPVLEEFARVVEEQQQLEGGVDGSLVGEKDPAPFELILGADDGGADSPALQSQISGICEQCEVGPENIQDAYPCTPMQEALFAMTARQPTTYTYRQLFRATQEVDVARFQKAWEKVLETLPILRTRIVMDHKSGFLQAVVDAPLKWHTGSDLHSYLEMDKDTSFEIGQPLLRCGLIKDEKTSTTFFVLTTHHSMFDRWSLERIYHHYLYPAYAGREMPNVVPYPRFIRYVLDTDMDAASQYWNRALTGGDTFTDFPSLPSMNHEFYQPKPTSTLEQKVSLDASQISKLRTPFPSVLRAAWALTVAQYASVDDVMFAVNLSGRSAPVADIADMAAPTFTTVPVRIKIDAAQRVEDFLQRVHQDTVDMIPYEHLGLQKIKDLVPTFAPADLRHLFLVHPAASAITSDAAPSVPGFEQIHIGLEAVADYPLSVICKVDGNQHEAVVAARFDSAVISDDRLLSILRQFEHNVAQLGHTSTAEDQTGKVIGSLQLANREDIAQISKWHPKLQTSQDLGCVHDLVRKAVSECPQSPAICSWDGELTYQQLDKKAKSLAHLLVTEGNVGPEVPVGLCMDKSRSAIVAMLAILYAGGAVVPLGVDHPTTRLKVILEDCSAAMILCDDKHASKFQAINDDRIVIVNDSLLTLLESYQSECCSLVQPENMAWIMYTSGSTGTPKGVVLEHRNLCSSLRGKSNICNISSKSRVFQFSAYTFDPSISDIFMPLACGGTVCVPSENERMNDLVGAIQRLGVNFVNVTPSTASLIHPSDVPAVETLVLGGEGMSAALVEKWLQFSKATIINSYGPVECSIASTANIITNKNESSVIGKPFPGTVTQTWVIDPQNHNRLAPVGAVGELLIEGPNLARGYINDPIKTSMSFITNPDFVSQVSPINKQGCRMYRTGDLVRYNTDGTLSIIGRGDSQVKIRGQRVDLGEIETCILRLVPDVRTAVVEYVRLDDDKRALFAALELIDKAISDFSSISSKLKTCLADKLPSYMVPRVCLQLATMPRTASGKTDRRAVRQFMTSNGFQGADDKTQADGSVLAKSTSVHGEKETLLRRVWADVLGVEEDVIDREDNFFTLGADSIGAMKLVASAKSVDLNIKVLDVFQNPVLKKLAAVGPSKHANGSANAHVPEQAAKQDYSPFQLLGGGLGIDSLLEKVVCPVTGTSKELIQDAFPATDAVAFNIVGALTSSQTEVNTFVLDTESDLDLVQLQQSCQSLAQHVEAFRTVFVLNPQDGQLLQVILKSYKHKVPVVEVDDSLETATERFLGGQEASRPFRLGQSMINMAILHQQESNRIRVLFRMSHALYDGLSLPVIWKILGALYHDDQNELKKPLSSFSSYLHDLLLQTTDDTYDYWRTLLEGSEMPAFSAATWSDNQSPLRMDFLEKKQIPGTRLEGVTTSTIISCAWAHVLAQYTGKDDIVFGDTISGRNLADPSISNGLVGCCATHVPMRVRFDTPGQTILGLLHQVRDQQRERIPHESLGFRTIIRDCTDWLPSTRFTSIVNHRPGRSSVKSNGSDVGLDFDVSVATSEHKPLTSWYDLAVISTENDGIIDLSLGYSTVAFKQETVEALLSNLAETVRIIMSAGSPRDPSLHRTESMPRSLSGLVEERSVEIPEEHGAEINYINEQAADVSTTLKEIWSSVFASKFGNEDSSPSEDLLHQMPFYQLGGDLLDAAHLANAVEHRRKTTNRSLDVDDRSGSYQEVTIDDVLQYPSLVEFAILLHQKGIELD